jgi:hypothetical protein
MSAVLAGAVAALAGLSGAAAGQSPTPAPAAQAPAPQVAAPQAPSLEAVYVKGSAGPLLDPNAPYWQDVEPASVPLLPQIMTKPQNSNPAVKSYRCAPPKQASGLPFSSSGAIDQSDRLMLDQFGDQVAVEMPTNLKAGAYPIR